MRSYFKSLFENRVLELKANFFIHGVLCIVFFPHYIELLMIHMCDIQYQKIYRTYVSQYFALENCVRIDLCFQEYILTYYGLVINIKIFSFLTWEKMSYLSVKVLLIFFL